MLKLLRDSRESVQLEKNFFEDLKWWKTFLPQWNGTCSFLSPEWTSPLVSQLYTDASGSLGMGGYFQGKWFACPWPAGFDVSSVTYLEIIPIYACCLRWGKLFTGKRLLFHCDNMGVVLCWEKLGSLNDHVLEIMRRIAMIAALNNFTLSVKHIPGVDNSIADALSRLQYDRFRTLAPNADPEPHTIPNFWPEILTPYTTEQLSATC